MLGPDAHIAWSTHTLEQVSASRDLPLDAIAYGPVFPTSSKSAAGAAVGIEGLKQAVASAAHPVIAIGGLDARRAAACIAAGAASTAVISALFEPWRGPGLVSRLLAFRGVVF